MDAEVESMLKEIGDCPARWKSSFVSSTEDDMRSAEAKPLTQMEKSFHISDVVRATLRHREQI